MRIPILISFILFLACTQNKPGNFVRVIPGIDTSTLIQPAVITDTTLNDTDDPAIWVNKADPSKSLILGTDKGDSTGGIFVFTLDGKLDKQKSIYNLKRPNNIDIEYGFSYLGTIIDIAVFTERGRNMIRVCSLPDMKFIDNGGIEVFKGDSLHDPMGISLFKDQGNKKVYAIVGRKTGPEEGYLWQYELNADAVGIVTGNKVRTFGRFSGKKEIEAIVVDDSLGYVYYSDEEVGVRQYYASPDSGNIELALFATTGIKGDHEGLSIFPVSKDKGYILLSDQQAGKFQIFSREGTYQKPFDHKLLRIVKVSAMESDGSDVTPLALNDTFRHGLFVVMSTDKTFHLYRWEDIAGESSGTSNSAQIIR